MEDQGRRSFLAQGGKIAGLAGLAGIGAAGMTGCPPQEAMQMPPLPWPWKTLDPEFVRKRAHKEYFAVHCCGGVFTAIVKTLAEEVGHPFDKIPTEMMVYGAGGVAGFASLCGTLNGAGAAINLVCDQATTTAIITELISWYSAVPLPSAESNQYAVNGEYLEGDPYTVNVELPQSVAKSNLCHSSVTNWCYASNYASGSPERAERCGRLAGDVAAKAVELLNAHFAGTFESEYPLPADAAGCRACHSIGVETSFTRGKMDCEICHEVDENHPMM